MSPANSAHPTSDSQALRGKRVLITRAREQAAELEQQLQALGAIPVAFPTIKIVPPTDDYAALDAALAQLASFDWAVFTSVNSVNHVWSRLHTLGLPRTAFASLQIAAIGPSTAQALTAHGLEIAVVPDRYVAEALLNAIPAPAGQRFLLPHADIARATIRTGLQAAGADVVEVPAYHTVLVESSPESLAILDSGIDLLTFTASSTVRQFIDQVGIERAQALTDHALVTAIGPITADTAREQGLRVDIVATEYTIAGLVAAMVQACES